MKHTSTIGFATLVTTTFLLSLRTTAHAEFVLSGFSGVSSAFDSDLHLHENNGTDLTFHDASYKTRDFDSPLYYGGRLTYFLDRESPWGFGLEFFHSKVYLDEGASVHVTGTRNGAPVNDTEPVSNTFNDFNCSHGLNYLTADAFYRFFLGQPDSKSFINRIQPYLGAGVGITIPHVEVELANQPRYEQYEFGGLGVQAIAGVSFSITKHIQLFTEYKFTYANLDKLDFSNGVTSGNISFDSMANHLVFGASYRF
jgi:lipid A oxidase